VCWTDGAAEGLENCATARPSLMSRSTTMVAHRRSAAGPIRDPIAEAPDVSRMVGVVDDSGDDRED